MCPFVGPHRTLSWFVAQCPRRLLATKISPLANKGTFTNCVDHFRPFFAFWKNEPSHFSVSELLDLKVFFEKNNNYTQSFLLSFQLCFVKWYFPISIYFLLFLIYFSTDFLLFMNTPDPSRYYCIIIRERSFVFGLYLS